MNSIPPVTSHVIVCIDTCVCIDWYNIDTRVCIDWHISTHTCESVRVYNVHWYQKKEPSDTSSTNT